MIVVLWIWHRGKADSAAPSLVLLWWLWETHSSCSQVNNRTFTPHWFQSVASWLLFYEDGIRPVVDLEFNFQSWPLTSRSRDCHTVPELGSYVSLPQTWDWQLFLPTYSFGTTMICASLELDVTLQTSQGKVLGFPDLVKMGSDETNPNKSRSDNGNRVFILHTHMHSMFAMNIESCSHIAIGIG